MAGGLLLVVPGVLGVLCWAVMLRWYGLANHGSATGFAFDKVPDHFLSTELRLTAVLMLDSALMYALGYVLLASFRKIGWGAIAGILVAAVGIGAVNVLLYPVGALDVFNYLLELKLAYFYQQNPYIVTFQQYMGDPFAAYGFYFTGTLFYGPVWLLLSHFAEIPVGFGDVIRSLVALKLLNVVLLAATGWLIYRYQRDSRRGWLAVYAFLANPLVLFEGVGNGHNDVMMGLFLFAAVLSVRSEPLLAAPLLTLSILVKFFTASVAPLFVLVAALRRWSTSTVVISVGVAVLVAAISAAAFWDGGRMLRGLWSGITVSQDMASSSLFSLAREWVGIATSPPPKRGAPVVTSPMPAPSIVAALRAAFLGLFALGAAAVMWAVHRGWSFERGVVVTYLLFAALLSLLYPWYLIPALALLACSDDRLDLGFLFVITATGLLYYPLSVWAWFNSGFSVFEIHIFQATFLTVPILAYLAARGAGFPLRRSIADGGFEATVGVQQP
jgi:hypothetical protein